MVVEHFFGFTSVPLQGFPGLAVYSGTKFFVEGVTSALRKELVGTGIRISNVQPGDVTSALFDNVMDREASWGFIQITATCQSVSQSVGACAVAAHCGI